MFLRQWTLAVFSTSGQVTPSCPANQPAWLSWWHSCRKVWAGFKTAHLNLTLPCQVLNFWADGWGEEGGTLVLRHELALHLSEGDNLGQVSYKKGPLNERIVDFLKLLETPSYPHVLWELV